MRRLDWRELTNWYNCMFDTNYKFPVTMLRNGKKKFKTWTELALKLGISYEMIRQYRKDHPKIDKKYRRLL